MFNELISPKESLHNLKLRMKVQINTELEQTVTYVFQALHTLFTAMAKLHDIRQCHYNLATILKSHSYEVCEPYVVTSFIGHMFECHMISLVVENKFQITMCSIRLDYMHKIYILFYV